MFTLVALGLMMLTSTMVSILTVTAVAATTALIMGGTGHSLSPSKDTTSFVQQYMDNAVDNYIAPSSTAMPDTGIPEGPYNEVAVITPAQFQNPSVPNSGPLTFDQSVAEGLANLDRCVRASGCEYNPNVGSTAPAAGDAFVVWGYSQSATIGTLLKRRLAAEFPDGTGPDVSFEFIGNGNRPNGGFLARGPQGFTIPMGLIFGGVTFSGPTPTDTQYETVDIAAQYDSWADVPLNPLNLVAMANWYLSDVHYNYKNVSLNDPGIINQGQYGDTTYYMIPTKILPLLTPVKQLPVFGYALADALDAPLRVIVESAYDRTLSPGQPAPWNPLYVGNPVELAASLAFSIPTGLDNAIEDTLGIRPFGTVRPGPYGVGGPDVTYVNPPATTATSATTESTAQTATHRLATESDDAKSSSSVTDSSTVATDSKAASESEKAPSDAASPSDSTTDDAVTETATKESTNSAKPEETTAAESVKTEEAPETTKTDAATPDTATKHSSSDPKSGDEAKPPAHPSRNGSSGTVASTSKTSEEQTSPTSTKTGLAAASTSSTPANDSTSQRSEGDSAQ